MYIYICSAHIFCIKPNTKLQNCFIVYFSTFFIVAIVIEWVIYRETSWNDTLLDFITTICRFIIRSTIEKVEQKQESPRTQRTGVKVNQIPDFFYVMMRKIACQVNLMVQTNVFWKKQIHLHKLSCCPLHRSKSIVFRIP